MQEPIQQRDNAGGVGEDLVPFLERSIGGENDRFALVAAVDNLVKQIGGLVVEGKIADLINTQQVRIGIGTEPAAAAFGRLALQILQQQRSGPEQHGVTSQHGGVTDIFGDQCFAQTIAADQHQIPGFGKKVQRERPFHDITVDPGGPGPIEIRHELEVFDAGVTEPPLQAAARAFGVLSLRQLFENLARRPARLDGPRQKIVEVIGNGA